MSFFQNNEYCWSTLDDIAKSYIGKDSVATTSGSLKPVAYVVTDSVNGIVTYNYQLKPYSAVAPSSFTNSVQYPICGVVGQVKNTNFDVSTLDKLSLVGAFGAGLTASLSILLVVWGVKEVLKTISAGK